VASFSAAGPTRDGKEKPDLCAPGVSVRGADTLTNGFRQDSGTSFAAPHVTGLIALMLQARVDLDIDAIRQHLLATARQTNPGYHPRTGHGRVDGLATLAAVLGQQEVTGPIMAAGAGEDGQYQELATLLEAMSHVVNQQDVNLRLTLEIEPNS
jgi:subtilisin family serine protease